MIAAAPRTGAHRNADRYWGCGDLDALFGEHSQVIAPWPRAPRHKSQPAFDRTEIGQLLRRPVDLAEIDPRDLWSSQPWVLRRHADHYLTGRWERTGKISADGHAELNQFPVVVLDHCQRSVIVSGHHRATAALVEGRPLLVRRAGTTAAQAVTPLLWWDPAVDEVDAEAVAARIKSDHRAFAPTLELAVDVLARLGVEPHIAGATTARVSARC